jgi:hypothetical protein
MLWGNIYKKLFKIPDEKYIFFTITRNASGHDFSQIFVDLMNDKVKIICSETHQTNYTPFGEQVKKYEWKMDIYFKFLSDCD